MDIGWFEIRRKGLHGIFGLLVIYLLNYVILDRILATIIISVTLAVLLIGTTIMLIFPNNYFKKIYTLFDREQFIDTFPGKSAVYYLFSLLITYIIFPLDVFSAAIIIMCVGDGIAALYGMHFGQIIHPFNKKKYVEGHFIAVIVTGIMAMYFVSPLEAFMASGVGMLVEGIDLKLGMNKIDDNLTVPVFAGFIIMLLRFFIF